MKLILLLLLAAGIGFLIGRTRSRLPQNRGEAEVRKALLSNFSSPDYHLLNNVTLRLEDGTTQIDHILVSRFGVFVIETKDYRGWIFANAQHATWTQVLFRAKFRFQNPIFQNLRHVRAVQARLDFLPPGTIQSAVVFIGDAEFKTPVPAGVFSLRGFVSYVREQTTELLSENRVQFSVGRLETARLAITRQTDVDHVRDLQRRHGL
jgi:hypothetical protein